ncbi:MAG: MarR family transcriptional regulator [Alphaproteobacteria bacterium]|nr:MarR family transcriptional regulator [Alphaproteobacteria bacterium]
MARPTSRLTAGEPGEGILPELLGYHLRRAQLAVFADFARSMGGIDLTPGQFGVLARIAANPGLSQSALGRAVGIERSTVVSLIDRLERRDLVVRGKAAGDRRANALALSAEGRRLFREASRRVRTHERRIARGLTPAEAQVLAGLLKKVVRP